MQPVLFCPRYSLPLNELQGQEWTPSSDSSVAVLPVISTGAFLECQCAVKMSDESFADSLITRVTDSEKLIKEIEKRPTVQKAVDGVVTEMS